MAWEMVSLLWDKTENKISKLEVWIQSKVKVTESNQVNDALDCTGSWVAALKLVLIVGEKLKEISLSKILGKPL